MQVPVFAIRHVLVKIVPPAITVLSGIVTSATKEALFVQLGSLVGLGGSGVRVNSAVEVDVAGITSVTCV